MGDRPIDRRKSLVINKQMQKKIIFAICLFPAISLSVATLIVAVFCRKLLSEAMMTEAGLPSLVPLFLFLLGFTIVSGAIVIHQALRFSHRIAGPAHRLIQSIDQVREGDISFRVDLRQGDHLTELADSFNQLLDWLNENPPAGVKTGSDVVQLGNTAKLSAVKNPTEHAGQKPEPVNS